MPAVFLPQHGPAACGDYAPTLAGCLCHSLRLQRAEGGFTLAFEQLRDGLPRALGDFIVRIVQLQRQKLRQPARQRALARPRHADQRNAQPLPKQGLISCVRIGQRAGQQLARPRSLRAEHIQPAHGGYF